MENNIQDACNKVGNLATQNALSLFDTDGSPIKIGSEKWTSKGIYPRKYQTPYGETSIDRHVYQNSRGGKTFCPLENNARIIRKATPRLAMQLSHKYNQSNVQAVCRDLEQNNNRKVSRSFVQNIVDWVGSIACAKEQNWEYSLPKINDHVASVVVSMDGANILIRDDGWREAMVGVISLYNSQGKRLNTIYIGQSPQYGKKTFKQRLEQEILKIKKHYPNAKYVAITDGAADNWSFLKKHTELQLLDYYHVTEYLQNVAMASFPQKTGKAKRQEWMEVNCHNLKHTVGTVDLLINPNPDIENTMIAQVLNAPKKSPKSFITNKVYLVFADSLCTLTTCTLKCVSISGFGKEMQRLARKTSLSKKVKSDLLKALTYFTNHKDMMDYPYHIEHNLPIGSGVTEAACKTLVKQRLCNSGMRWKKRGAQMVLTLRALVQSTDRWAQFWSKIDRYGASK